MPQPARAVPTWIASGGGFLAAWVHLPAGGRARGVVVLVPAIGREAVVSHRAWHVLANDLSAAGHAVVRFSLRGDADSSPLDGDDPVACWLDDLRAAIGLAAALVPGVPVSLVGLRIGASLTARLDDPRVGHRTLWEPVSGRRYLRHHAALRAMAVAEPPVDDEGVVELAGTHFDAVAARAIRALRAPAPDAPGVLCESDRRVAERLYLVESHEAVIPRARLSAIVAAQPVVEARAVQPVVLPTRVRLQVDGVAVRQELVEVGRHRLRGVLTIPDERPVEVGVSLWAGGAEPKDGPTGLWAALARSLAADGAACLRVDRRLVGDELDPAEDMPPNPYLDSGIEDVVAAREFLADRTGAPQVAVGLSAACWTLARAAARTHFDELVLLNSIGWHHDAARYAVYDQAARRHREGLDDLDPATATAPPLGARVRELVRARLQQVAPMVPGSPWRALSEAGLVMDAGPLLTGIPTDTSVLVVVSGHDVDVRVWHGAHGPQAVREMAARGQEVAVLELPVDDHAMLSLRLRRLMVDIVRDRVERRLDRRRGVDRGLHLAESPEVVAGSGSQLVAVEE